MVCASGLFLTCGGGIFTISLWQMPFLNAIVWIALMWYYACLYWFDVDFLPEFSNATNLFHQYYRSINIYNFVICSNLLYIYIYIKSNFDRILHHMNGYFVLQLSAKFMFTCSYLLVSTAIIVQCMLAFSMNLIDENWTHNASIALTCNNRVVWEYSINCIWLYLLMIFSGLKYTMFSS